MRSVDELRERIAESAEGHAVIKAEQIAKGVREHGWSPDADCSICGDTGTVPYSAYECRCPAGMALMIRRRESEERAKRARKWSDGGVPRRFDSYRLEGCPNQPAADQARAWLDANPIQTGANLIITGPVGVGKTGLAVGALWELLCREDQYGTPTPVRFIGVPMLLDGLRPDSGASPTLLRDCQWATTLVLDDLGATRGSDWEQERLYILVNHRYEKKAPTIITTNVGLKQLAESIGERTVSRLTELATPIAVDGADQRRTSAR